MKIKAWIAMVLCMGILVSPVLAEEFSKVELSLPIGEPNPASQWMFTGQSFLYPLVERDDIWNTDTMINVTFEPCCRTDWHSHAGGQVLIAISGIGIHQVRGREPELLLPGTVAKVEPGVMHWHGSAGGWFQHIAIETNNTQQGLEHGDKIDDDYFEAVVAEAMAASE